MSVGQLRQLAVLLQLEPGDLLRAPTDRDLTPKVEETLPAAPDPVAASKAARFAAPLLPASGPPSPTLAALEAATFGPGLPPRDGPGRTLGLLLDRVHTATARSSAPRHWALLLSDLAAEAAGHFRLADEPEIGGVYADLARRLGALAQSLPTEGPGA